MTAGVAKLAGVRGSWSARPPTGTGNVKDAILAAASICGVDEVYRVGGAQSIAALAYGTESVPKVSKIVGPGGLYVSVAKRLVSRDVPDRLLRRADGDSRRRRRDDRRAGPLRGTSSGRRSTGRTAFAG